MVLLNLTLHAPLATIALTIKPLLSAIVDFTQSLTMLMASQPVLNALLATTAPPKTWSLSFVQMDSTLLLWDKLNAPVAQLDHGAQMELFQNVRSVPGLLDINLVVTFAQTVTTVTTL